MSYDLERSAIETYFLAQWASATPVGMDGHAFTPVNNSVLLTLTAGAARQGSIGRTLNRIDHVGLVTFSIYTEGGKGSKQWRTYAETIMGLFFEKTLSQAGALITSHAQAFIRFSPPEMGDNRHPYIAASFADPPHRITNVIAPFVRYSYR